MPIKYGVSSKQIKHLFTPPEVEVNQAKDADGRLSVLYLLRRELQACFIGQVTRESKLLEQREYSRLFASAILAFAGIDLLAKFEAGSDDNPVRDRFTTFLQNYGGCKESDAKTLWEVRNALMHSFGLYIKKHDVRFVLDVHPRRTQKGLRTPITDSSGKWTAYVDGIILLFLRCLTSYKARLYCPTNGPTLRKRLSIVYKNYATHLVS